MSQTVIQLENISKMYSLGQVGKASVTDDLKRTWARMRGKEDPFAAIAEANDRSVKGNSDYVWALKDINFEVKKGEVLGIIGKNGAGKSTLLKILSRTTAPTTGSFKVKGRITSLLEVGTGFHPDLTGRENIFLNGAILGMTKREIQSKFDEIVDFSGVERYIDTPVKRYSSGMYVRLAFAVAAQLEPEILIIDEVLSVGDADFQKKSLARMKKVAENGNTVLFVSHNALSVQDLCSRAIFLEQGKMAFEGAVDKAIVLYFGETTKNTKEKEFNRFEKTFEGSEMPGNDFVRVRSVSLLDEDGQPLKAVTISKSFIVSTRFTVTKTCTKPMFSISLHAGSGDPVFGSISNSEPMLYGKPYEPGEYVMNCEIPGNFINNGLFYVNLSGYAEEFSHHFVIENPVGFEAFEDGILRKEYKSNFGGYIRPKLNWNIHKAQQS